MTESKAAAEFGYLDLDGVGGPAVPGSIINVSRPAPAGLVICRSTRLQVTTSWGVASHGAILLWSCLHTYLATSEIMWQA